eukprot:TRINITY_DN55980_c0_g1_i1.p1 TRINITY_DN55980_c0_g1~~TRINITY_DN55980_c0_g1_i1.p1  ORF type:complete len:262 (+),score=59.69 TRINITY_DN55980_c0_g1_i1:87-788(+)
MAGAGSHLFDDPLPELPPHPDLSAHSPAARSPQRAPAVGRPRPRTAAPRPTGGITGHFNQSDFLHPPPVSGSGAVAALSLSSSTMVNARGIVKKAGGLYAVAHPHAKTGYKLDMGSKRLEGRSEYSFAYGPTQGGVYEKKLQRYSMNAMRNRVKPARNEWAGRYSSSGHGRPRSAGAARMGGAGDLLFQREPPHRFATTNHKEYRAVDPHPTGSDNPAIAAFQTRFRRQLMGE